MFAPMSEQRHASTPLRPTEYSRRGPTGRSRATGSVESSDYEPDFRPDGIERNRATHEQITWESVYREIGTDERIV